MINKYNKLGITRVDRIRNEGQLRSSTLEKKRDKAEIVWDSGFTVNPQIVNPHLIKK